MEVSLASLPPGLGSRWGLGPGAQGLEPRATVRCRFLSLGPGLVLGASARATAKTSAKGRSSRRSGSGLSEVLEEGYE